MGNNAKNGGIQGAGLGVFTHLGWGGQTRRVGGVGNRLPDGLFQAAGPARLSGLNPHD
jgi:hypothetical protein